VKAIVVTDQAAGTAGMTLVERPEPQAAINDVVVQVHASGFTSGELTWPSTWTDRLDRDRTPSIPGQELAGVVIEDWHQIVVQPHCYSVTLHVRQSNTQVGNASMWPPQNGQSVLRSTAEPITVFAPSW
jgi:hypothetical protein